VFLFPPPHRLPVFFFCPETKRLFFPLTFLELFGTIFRYIPGSAAEETFLPPKACHLLSLLVVKEGPTIVLGPSEPGPQVMGFVAGLGIPFSILLSAADADLIGAILIRPSHALLPVSGQDRPYYRIRIFFSLPSPPPLAADVHEIESALVYCHTMKHSFLFTSFFLFLLLPASSQMV